MKTIKLVLLIVILTALAACGGKDGDIYITGSSSTPPTYSGATPPAGDPGDSTFASTGGNATESGYGGYGGSIDIASIGDVWMTTSGSVDASFEVPAVTPAYGDNKLTISADKTVQLDLAGNCDAGDVYLTTDSPDLTYCATADTPLIASGLEVQAGATLTLPENYAGEASAKIALAQAVTINGTVKPAAEGVSLSIESGNLTGAIPVGLLQVGAAGQVTTKPATPGTSGRSISLRGDGIAINLGTIDASGSDATAAATPGGAAGNITFTGNTDVYNTGSILTKGGASDEDAGGNGGSISIYAYAGTMYHSGTIDNSGGNGATTGGDTGSITLQGGRGYDYNTDTYTSGSVIAGGFLTSRSGAGGSDHAGDNSGNIQLLSYGGKIWSSATINTQGGSSDDDEGGDGGNVSLVGYGGNGGYGGISDKQTEGIEVGGTITLSAGNGATGGGDGGSLSIRATDTSFEGLLGVSLPSPMVWMKGFDRFNIYGGEGVTMGGGGGGVMIQTYPHWTENPESGGSRVPVGAIFNQVPFFAQGGAATDGEGGFGNMSLMVQSAMEGMPTTPYSIISNSGSIDISGGAGVTGGLSGLFGMLGVSLLENSGTLTGRGGAGTTTGGNGGIMDGMVFVFSAQTVNNSGALDASGGAGGTAGGNSGMILADAGFHLWNSAAITAAGGAGADNGGNGGYIVISSGIVTPTSNTGILSVVGGAGTTAGADGVISID